MIWTKRQRADTEQLLQKSGDAGRSLFSDAMDRFRRNRAAMISVYLLSIITLLAVFVPIFWPYQIEDMAWDYISTAPSLETFHLFGTDGNGRDLFVRVMYGGRISLTIGVLTTVVALIIGVTYGTFAGYTGGRVDNFMMRFVDILYAMPLLFLIILLVTVAGPNIYLVFLGIGAVEWLTMARIVRGQTLSIKRKEYVESALAIGLSGPRIIRRYIVPNIIGPVIVFVTLLIPTNIVVESYLSFLGLGVQEPLTSWGLLISQGATQLNTAPWLLIFPATLLSITMFCFNFIGDGLRDALDPRDR
ncbi:ABC transporter permease [Govanella unica]|uniref:Oligopeptide transport system permease protein OppC n=1 Tax=Govanella unica TaxID=2975056 RepID=A0A9X3TVR6_9PROT|nr:ABC transporter permease subunit [Govania unica]MDA5192905.1 ABC transporter permease subunit [Govania unica]